MDHLTHSESLVQRLHDGLDRIASVMRAAQWTACGGVGINPTQARVLDLLSTRAGGMRASDIARHLGLTPPTIADTLAALDRKALVTRAPDPGDGRASRVAVTGDGERVARAVARAASPVRDALAELSAAGQADLLRIEISLIRSLQHRGAIPIQRMCTTCRHFCPDAHPGMPQQHHCGFIDAPIGDRDLRLDCADHAPVPALTTAHRHLTKDQTP